MVPEHINRYLAERGVSAKHLPHRRAVGAQEVAQSLDVSGYRVAKAVVFETDGERWLAVLPAPGLVDTDRLAEILDRPTVRLLDEGEFEGLFPGCRPGAEPPFGSLFGLRVLMDDALRDQERMVVRAGTHEDALELSVSDFEALERPTVGTFAVLPEKGHYVAEPDIPAPG